MAGQVDEGRSCHEDSAEKVEKRGEITSDEAAGAKTDHVDARGGTGGELKLADSLSVINKSAGGFDDGNNDVVDDKKGVGASAAAERGCRSAAVDLLDGRNVLDWTAADVLTWIRALPRGLAAFAEAEAFAKGRVDGKKLATLTLSDIKRKEFRHAKLKAKVRVEINQADNCF